MAGQCIWFILFSRATAELVAFTERSLFSSFVHAWDVQNVVLFSLPFSLAVQSQVIALPTTRHPTYVAAQEYTMEIPPKRLKLQEEIGAGKILEPMHL